MKEIKQQHLHSNMFLLIPVIKRSPVSMFEFTFQYVSINTEVDGKSREERFDLHSNMFLLIPGKATEG